MMLRCLINLSLNLLLLGCAYAGSPSAHKSSELAAEVRAVFVAKCTECHGAHLAQPEGRFGYVLDIARVAANPEMVIRFSAQESELWELVRRGEMPPAEATAGPLSEDEKEIIRSWIAVGAPAPVAASGDVRSTTTSGRKELQNRKPDSRHAHRCR